MNQTQGTEPSNAPSTRILERQGQRTEPYVKHLPKIYGGVCEHCGIIDPHVASQDQWRLCQHFRGISEMRCSYCDESVNPAEVVRRAVLNITEHPNDPNRLIVCCDSYTCVRKHEQRFRVSG